MHNILDLLHEEKRRRLYPITHTGQFVKGHLLLPSEKSYVNGDHRVHYAQANLWPIERFETAV